MEIQNFLKTIKQDLFIDLNNNNVQKDLIKIYSNHYDYSYYKKYKIALVIGNQSADLDSIVCSIVFSYYMNENQKMDPFHNMFICKFIKEFEYISYLPVINSTREIIKAKKECMFLLSHFNIDIDNDLVFLSDLTYKQTSKIQKIFLVDHNKIDNENLCNFENFVCGIIDHHKDCEEYLKADPRIIDTTVASNASLITHHFISQMPKSEIPKCIAEMLLFPILSDTFNLKSRLSSSIDKEALEFLSKLSNRDKSSLNQLYNQIENLKYEIEVHEIEDDMKIQLIKDYKQFTNKTTVWGIACVNFSIGEFLEWCDDVDDYDRRIEIFFQKHIREFMTEKKLSFFGILSCFKSNNDHGFSRDLILFYSNCEFNLTKFFDDEIKLESDCENYGPILANSLDYFFCKIKDNTLGRKYWKTKLESCF